MSYIKTCIVICGGGGKSTLFKENSNKYLDIDHFIWQDPIRKIKLENMLSDKDIEGIGKLYQEVMETNEELRNDPRIILVHRPENAEWLDRTILGIYRPSKKLHNKNIIDRPLYLQEMARKDWDALDKYNPIEYDTFPFL